MNSSKEAQTAISRVFRLRFRSALSTGIGVGDGALKRDSVYHQWLLQEVQRQHGLPGFDRVVPQHPPTGLRHWGAWRHPAVGTHRDPLHMSCRQVVLELKYLLLLRTHKPAFAVRLLLFWISGVVLVRH